MGQSIVLGLAMAPRVSSTVVASVAVSAPVAVLTFVTVAASLAVVAFVAVTASASAITEGSTVRTVRLMLLSKGRSRRGWRSRRLSSPRPESCRSLVDRYGRVQLLRLAGCHGRFQLLRGECRRIGRTDGSGRASCTGRVAGNGRAGGDGAGTGRYGRVQLLRRKQWRTGTTGGSRKAGGGRDGGAQLLGRQQYRAGNTGSSGTSSRPER